jgi:hypothetical protein
MSNFQKASRLKLRFSTNKGELSTEDLWDLSLESLDVIAKGVNKRLKDETEESFIGKKSTNNTVLELKLELLKEVIEFKLKEKEAKALRSAKNAKLAQLKELANNKANEQMSGMSLEEINKLISELETEEV